MIKEILLEATRPDPSDPNKRWIVKAVCTIRTNQYGSSLQKFIEFAQEARRDYPGLRNEDIRIVHYGGQRYKGTFGIEFEPPDGTVAPPGWTEVTRLEYEL